MLARDFKGHSITTCTEEQEELSSVPKVSFLNAASLAEQGVVGEEVNQLPVPEVSMEIIFWFFSKKNKKTFMDVSKRMEECNKGPAHSENSPGVHDRVCRIANSGKRAKTVEFTRRASQGGRLGDRGNVTKGCNTSNRRSLERLSQHFVFSGEKGQRMETGNKLEKFKSVFGLQTFQDGSIHLLISTKAKVTG